MLFHVYLTYLVFVFKIREKKYHFNDIFYSNQIFWSKSLKMAENILKNQRNDNGQSDREEN